MIKASIISIGNELLSGETVNTNAAHLSAELLNVGIPVVTSYAIGDEIDDIVLAFERACTDADIILITGGLGPTDDDLTRQAMAKFLGVGLELHADLLEKIERFFASRGLPMPEKNRIQAWIPAGAGALPSIGTAPGIRAEWRGKLLFALPGVPMEMERMFAESVAPELKRLAGGQAVVVRKLRCFGAGESAIAERLGDRMQRGRNPLVNCTVGSGVVTLHIVASARTEREAELMARQDEESLRSALGELVFGTADQTLAQVVGEELARQGKTLALAESCTGGLLAELVTDIPGASRYFTHGWVTYSNDAKTSELGVPAAMIERYGAVSEQVAEAMARGAQRKAGADFAVGITGIAGPTGATEQKPVGLVYISVGSSAGCDTRRFVFAHERRFMRLRAALTALNMLRLKLNI